MGVGVVNRTLNIDSLLSWSFCLSEHLDFGAGQRGLDNRGWTVLCSSCIRGSLRLAQARSELNFTEESTFVSICKIHTNFQYQKFKLYYSWFRMWTGNETIICTVVACISLLVCVHIIVITVTLSVVYIRDIEANIKSAKQAIAQYKEDLQQARVIRRHRQEYDALAMVRYLAVA